MKRLSIALALAVLIMVMTTLAIAGKVPTPKKLRGGQVVTVDEVRALVGKEGVYIFDMRKALNYGRGHIPGAISTPYKWRSKGSVVTRKGWFDISRLPEDKSATVIFYSDGPMGWKSYKASQAAIKEGYKKVLYFRGGSSTWINRGFPLER